MAGEPLGPPGRGGSRQRGGHPGTIDAWRVGRGKSKQWLYLFTTLTMAASDVVELYGKRWIVETDLRSLKQTVRLQRLAVHSPST